MNQRKDKRVCIELVSEIPDLKLFYVYDNIGEPYILGKLKSHQNLQFFGSFKEEIEQMVVDFLIRIKNDGSEQRWISNKRKFECIEF